MLSSSEDVSKSVLICLNFSMNLMFFAFFDAGGMYKLEIKPHLIKSISLSIVFIITGFF